MTDFDLSALARQLTPLLCAAALALLAGAAAAEAYQWSLPT